MHVVVVMCERLHDARGPGEFGVGADEDVPRSCGNESVDQVLSKTTIDLAWSPRFTLAPVAARVVDVDVEAILMRRMTETAKMFTEIPTVAAAEISDPHARRVRMFRRVRSQNSQR